MENIKINYPEFKWKSIQFRSFYFAKVAQLSTKQLIKNHHHQQILIKHRTSVIQFESSSNKIKTLQTT